jgi:hypothetical protein
LNAFFTYSSFAEIFKISGALFFLIYTYHTSHCTGFYQFLDQPTNSTINTGDQVFSRFSKNRNNMKTSDDNKDGKTSKKQIPDDNADDNLDEITM